MRKLFEELEKEMMEGHVAVNKMTNPVASGNLNQSQLLYAVEQYTLFAKRIVSLLSAAKEAALTAGWRDVTIELSRNIAEENGSETNGVPHYAMLADAMRRSLGIDIRKIVPCNATESFLGSMMDHMARWAPYSAGAAYATEASAVPELEMVREMTDRISGAMIGYPVSQRELKDYFERHMENWEVGHREGLKDACRKYIIGSEGEFCNGFRDVMMTMDRWWNGLYGEALQLK